MKLKSTFALLDVLGEERHQLAKRMPDYRILPRKDRIPVVITGFISHRWGGDDGTSIEFGIDVTDVEITVEGDKLWASPTTSSSSSRSPRRTGKASRKTSPKS